MVRRPGANARGPLGPMVCLRSRLSLPMNKTGTRQFYFSLFRLLALFRGGDARRAESNGFEAWLVGLMIYSIHYLFFATLLHPIPSQTLADSAAPGRRRVLGLAFLAAPPLHQFRDHQGCCTCADFSARFRSAAPKVSCGAFRTTAMACALLKGSPIVARDRRHLVGGGRDESGRRGGLGF